MLFLARDATAKCGQSAEVYYVLYVRPSVRLLKSWTREYELREYNLFNCSVTKLLVAFYVLQHF